MYQTCMCVGASLTDIITGWVQLLKTLSDATVTATADGHVQM